jgi:hypothetical protein
MRTVGRVARAAAGRASSKMGRWCLRMRWGKISTPNPPREASMDTGNIGTMKWGRAAVSCHADRGWSSSSKSGRGPCHMGHTTLGAL